METTYDIVDDIRAQNQGLPEDGYALSPLVCDLLRLADRIEQATNCNQQKMREALLMVKKLFDERIMFQNDIRKAHKAVDDALSTPSRNCDLYKSEPEAYQAYLTAMKNVTKKTYVFFEPWLFAEAKGV